MISQEQARSVNTHLRNLFCIFQMVMVWSPTRHETLAILNPNVVLCPGLMLMSGLEITIACNPLGVLPLDRIVDPVLQKIDPRLWACRAKQGQLPVFWLLLRMPKSKPL